MAQLNDIVRTDRTAFDLIAAGTHSTETYDDNTVYLVELDEPVELAASGSGLSINNDNLLVLDNLDASKITTGTFPDARINSAINWNAKLGTGDIIDNVSSTATNKTLSANLGKLLNDRINNLESIGRFLSLWNCTTGLPLTNPSTLPYTYRTGDYYRISTIDETTNLMPEGTSYSGSASTTAYGGSETLVTGDLWFFDGTTWGLLKNHIGGFVEDVQLNNTSIVSGGIANIPYNQTINITYSDGTTATLSLNGNLT